jgi:Flp pilus assembly pilin Flp
MMTLFRRFAGDESGITAIEYALIAGLAVLGIISSVTLLGTTFSNGFYALAAHFK